VDTIEPLASECEFQDWHPGRRTDATTRVQGAWIRQGLAVGDGPFREMSDVLWLQVGPFFADIRLPRPSLEGDRALGGIVMVNALNAARAFSGTVSGGGDRLLWHHDLDTMAVRPAHDDSAVVLRFADLLIEAGAGYVERWHAGHPRPVEGSVFERRTLATGAVDARMLHVGDDAVAVWATPARGGARLQRLADGCWVLAGKVGAQRLSEEVATTLPGRDELVCVLEDTVTPVRSGRDESRWVSVPV
jgi:hypothetical protein